MAGEAARTIDAHPLVLATEPIPVPAPGEVLIRALACGVCRTDLHVAEGDLPVHRPHVTLGHEVVGEVVAVHGEDAGRIAPGDRVGVAWPRGTCGTCRYCRHGAENLCPNSTYTGWDADGGYADFVTAPVGYVHRLPGGYTDAELAPLLCAGIIGYRALARAELPQRGGLGIYGFGASAHLAAQVALARGAVVHVMTPRRGRSRTRAGTRRGVRGRAHRRATGAAGLRDPVRPGGRAGAARAAGARSWRHPCHRGHPPWTCPP
jgi:propanol-preferring alcohol dehydrogenase